MVKPADFTKFRKKITKEVTGASFGFHDPETWISTGNYCLNYRISKNFKHAIPLGKVTVFAGESGSGKSYLASGNVVREAQKQGIFIVMIDSENALDETWLQNLGVDTSDEALLKINVAMIDDVAKIINDFVTEYKADYLSLPKEDRPKVLFVIDSLGMLLTPTDVAQFSGGDMKGDMGRKAKQLKALVTNCVNMFGELEIGMVATNHTYASQNMFSPDDVVSGGAGFVYASSILIAMQKFKLKEDEEGNAVKDVTGIKSKCKIMKTRFNKPFETVDIKIPYDTGMDPFSGLFDMFEASGDLSKEGNRYVYTTLDGTEYKMFRKAYERNEDGVLDAMMADRMARDELAPKADLYKDEEMIIEDDDVDFDAETQENDNYVRETETGT